MDIHIQWNCFLDYILSNCVIKKHENAIENMTIVEYNIKRKRGTQKRRTKMNTIMPTNRLKQLRKDSKITQEQLAQYLGVDQSLITKLENGTRSLNITLIEKICNLFGCSEEYLLGGEDAFIPLNFAFRANSVQSEDLESIASINKIVMNIRYMKEMLGEE